MAQIKDILEPAKAFQPAFQEYKTLVEKTFDECVKKSEVKVQENNQTCSTIYDKQAKRKKAERKQGTKKGLKIFLIILTVIAGIVGLVGVIKVAAKKDYSLVAILLLALGFVVMITLIIVLCVPLRKSMKKTGAIIQKLTEEINELTKEAWAQMRALNNQFGWNMPQEMISETVPLIQLDSCLQPKRLDQLVNYFEYSPFYDDDTTILSVQSGSIVGNPFIIEKLLSTKMGTHTYTGSIVITWTEYTTDSNGRRVARTRSQTLTASLTKPKPFYDTTTYLTYLNEACPNLSFTRQPANLKDGASEKEIAKFVKKQGKKIAKLSKKALKKGESFTAMGNTEFEALFSAPDRDNEVEYRMLFTPIGQKNMIDIIKNNPYGDDFSFIKSNTANRIFSRHSQTFDYHADPDKYVSFDYNVIKNNFMTYCLQYFQSLYYDLAPILAIPLYQQYKSTKYIYKDDDDYGVTPQEIESLANYAYFNDAINFAHPSTATDVILKCRAPKAVKNGTTCRIDAYSYKTIPHVTNIPMRGGDGRMHNVPVHWLEYIAVEKSTNVIAAQPIKWGLVHKIKTWDEVTKKIGIEPKYMQKHLCIA